MASTYTPIATQTLGSTASSVTFSSIPSTYTDLVIIAQNYMNGSQANLFLQMGNGSVDTGSNYSDTHIYGTGSSAGSDRDSGSTRIFFTPSSYPQTTTWNMSIFNFMDYANTNKYKSVMIRSNNAAVGTDTTAGLWRSSSAIDVIKIYPSNNSFEVGSTFTLYGIKAA